MNRWSPYFLSILRIIAAFVYGVHGTQKLFSFPAPFPVPHLPSAVSGRVGGLLLLPGLFTPCFTASFLYLASAGGGPWSFDRLLQKRASTV